MNSQDQAQEVLAADSCSSQQIIGPYNSGWILEGMSILSAAIKNSTIQQRVQTAIKPALEAQWTNDDGILVGVNGHGSDPNLIRGLRAAYSVSGAQLDVRAYIQAYIGVQYNALLELATSGGSNIYAGQWAGPPSSSYDNGNQTTAAEVFVDALALSAANASRPLSAHDNPPPAKKSRNTGAIVGGVVGGVVLVVVAFSLWVFLRYRRRQQRRRRQTAWEIDTSDPRGMAGFISLTSLNETSIHDGDPELSKIPSSAYGLTDSVKTRTEKGGLRSRAEAGLSEPRTGNKSQQSVSTVAGEASASGQEELPTEELVRILNERTRDRVWDSHENPPQYDASDQPRCDEDGLSDDLRKS